VKLSTMTCGDWPSQMAGRAVRATRSRRLRRSSAASSAERLAGVVISSALSRLAWLSSALLVPGRGAPGETGRAAQRRDSHGECRR